MDALSAAWLTSDVGWPPAPVAAGTSWTGMAGVSGLLLSASIIAALITGTINLTLARRRSREEERARARNTFAEAFKAYRECRESPNGIARRDAARSGEERQRLFEARRQLDARLAYYRT